MTVRLPDVQHHPLRIVLDTRGRSPVSSRIFSDSLPSETLVVTSEQANKQWCQQLRDKNIEVLQFATENQVIDLKHLLSVVAQRGISSVLVEGGAKVNGSFIEQGLVQRIYAYIAPKTIGGDFAPGALAGKGIEKLFDAQQWQFTQIKSLNPDVLLVAEKENV